MGSAIAEVVPAAIGVVLVNPMPVMAVIVMLFSPRASATAPAFVLGWVLGMVGVFGVLLFVIAPENIVGDSRDPSTLALVVKIVIGLALLRLAWRNWRGHSSPDKAQELPGWIASLESASPWTALGLGAFFSGLNPKNLAFILAAAVAIAQAELTAGEKFIPVAIYILLASCGVAAPVIWHAVDREGASATLAVWRSWLSANYALVMAIVLFLFGVVLVSQGIGGLIGEGG